MKPQKNKKQVSGNGHAPRLDKDSLAEMLSKAKALRDDFLAKMEAPSPLLQAVELYLSQHHDLRYNEVVGRVELRKKGASAYELLTDFGLHSLSRELMLHGIQCPTGLLWGVLHSNFVPMYNPFEAYFDGLPSWDGQDYIGRLAATVPTSDSAHWPIYLKKWLVALVACLLTDKVNHTMLILVGRKQGQGKSSWLDGLVPPELVAYLYRGLIRPGDKDSLVLLSEKMLINVDELEVLSKSALGALKQLITRAGVCLRKPYGRSSENLPRRASFCGSLNLLNFLTDSTGNRRFLVFEVLENIDFQHSVPMSLVYAQAKALFVQGFQYWFNTAEIAELNQSNERFRAVSLEEEQLLLHMEPCTEAEADNILTTSQIAEWLSKISALTVSNSSIARLGRALTQHNFLRLKRGGVYRWAIRYRNDAAAQEGNETRKPKALTS